MTCYKESRRRGMFYKQSKERRLTGMVTLWPRNCLLKHVIEGKVEGRVGVTEDDEEDVRSYWKASREREGTGN
jgi:hypothetical protein